MNLEYTEHHMQKVENQLGNLLASQDGMVTPDQVDTQL